MSDRKSMAAKLEAGLERLVEQAAGDARKLAALAVLAGTNGLADRAYLLAKEARALAPGDPDILSMTNAPLTTAVPKWHFNIVRDTPRNEAFEAALVRAVRPDTRVLDIGAGTGLLAMMAARAGATSVITCEMNPAVADAAVEIVALNGFADRVRVVARRSTELEAEADMGGRADLLVSEIVANDLLCEGALPVMEDAVRRLLKPGGQVIPSSGEVRIALAHWAGLAKRRLGDVAGFDMTPFDRLDRVPLKLAVGAENLVLRSVPASLFDFDFASGGPYPGGSAQMELVAEGGPVNGVVQWIRLRLDADGVYENRPGPGAASSWAALFYPLEREIDAAAGQAIGIAGAYTRHGIRIWRKT